MAKLIVEFNRIINSKKALYKLITEELENIKDKFSTPRKTKIIDAVLNYNIEETIQKESVVISITNQGYIKRSPLSSLKPQKRGGKGKTGISTEKKISWFKYLQLILIHQFYFFLYTRLSI